MGSSVSSGFVSGGCVGVVSGGVVGFVSSGCVVGVVGASVACWVDWVSVGTISSADPAGVVSSVLFSDESGTVGVVGVRSDIAGPEFSLPRVSVRSVWESQASANGSVVLLAGASLAGAI